MLEASAVVVRKSFDEAIGLRVVGGGGLMRDVEARAERSPECRGELRTSVGIYF